MFSFNFGTRAAQWAVFSALALLAPALAANEPPVASAYGFGIYENTSLDVYAPGLLINASDPDGDAMTANLALGPAHGSVTVNPDGSFLYIPDPGYSGDDSFDFTVSDGQASSLPATVTITIIPLAPPPPVNQPPAAEADNYVTDEDMAFSVPAPGVLANDTDPEGDVLTAMLVSDAASGKLIFNADGSFDYIPEENFNGSDSFTYQAVDSAGIATIATVTITVNAIADAPVAADDYFSIQEDGSFDNVKTWVLGNDSDADGDLLIAVLVTQPMYGKLELNADGTFVYYPEANFYGQDFFTYMASDALQQSAPAQVTIDVLPINDPPSFNGGGDITVEQHSGSYFMPWASEISAGPNEKQATWFQVSTYSSTDESLFDAEPAIDEQGNLSFSVHGKMWGSAEVTVTLYENTIAGNLTDVTMSCSLTFRIIVLAAPQAPSFVLGENVSVGEDSGPQSFANWVTNISGINNTQVWQFMVIGNSNASLFAEQPMLGLDGKLSFAPAANEFGESDITVILCVATDLFLGDMGASIPQTFRISVTPVNDAPSFIGGASISASNDGGEVVVAQWASSMSAGPANESIQRLYFEVVYVSNPALFAALPTLDADGTLRFQTATLAAGTATVIVRIRDQAGLIVDMPELGIEGGLAVSDEVVAEDGTTWTFTIEVTDMGMIVGGAGGDSERQAALIENVEGSCSTNAGLGWSWLLALVAPAAWLLRRRSARA